MLEDSALLEDSSVLENSSMLEDSSILENSSILETSAVNTTFETSQQVFQYLSIFVLFNNQCILAVDLDCNFPFCKIYL